jgi:hypothetical protein
MAKYAATTTCVVYQTIETAVAGLETTLEAIDQGKALIRWDIVRIPGDRFAVWTCYTDAV